jgi:UMF1 family MFS transporter
MSGISGLLRRIGLGDRKHWSWALYDFGNSGFATTIMAVLLPIYFFDVAAKHLPENIRTAYWGYGAGISLLFVALMSPLLGAAADSFGKKKFFILAFTVLGCVSSAALWFVGEGDWPLAMTAYVFGNIGFSGALIFYDSLLPHITHHDQSDHVSLAGYALGYLGGGILLALNLAWISNPEFWGFAGKGDAVRASFISVGVWWFVFTMPLLIWVDEPSVGDSASKTWSEAFSAAFKSLRITFREIRSYRRVLLFLIAFWVYSDGIGTIIKMATTYGREIGIDQSSLIAAMLATQLLGLPFTFLYSPIVSRFSAKTGLLISLAIYSLISVLAFFMTSAAHFWGLAIMIAFVQGGSQALSRSIFSGMIPKGRSAEFFSFFSVSSKFAGVLGPLIFGLMAQGTGSGRGSILLLVLFFAVGALLVAPLDLSPLTAERKNQRS